MRRLLLVVLLAAGGLLLGAGPATAATPPVPDNPLANAGVSAFSPKPDPLPPANQPFDSSDLLSVYGPAGPTFHYYDLNPLEEVGASMWVQLENSAMDLPKLAITADASFATWVFNPRSFLDQLAAPTDDTSSLLNEQIAKPWTTIALLFVGCAVTWAARKGYLHVAFTRVAFVLLGLCLIGLSVRSPSSLAGWASGVVTDTVSGVLVPTVAQVDDNVKSDADAAAYAYAKKQAQATVGTKMLGPVWEAAVYRPWLMGTLGSTDSKTAKDYGPALFQGQAFTWREATDVEGNKDATKALTDKDNQDWKAAAAKVNDTDPNAYRYLQGSDTGMAPVFVSWMVVLTCLPFLTVALLMTLAGYAALYFLAAVLGVVGLAIIIWPGIARRVGWFLVAVLVNTVVFASASVVITKFAGALFGGPNVLLAAAFVGVLSFVAWRFLRSFRGFKKVNVEQVAAPAVRVKGVKDSTKKKVVKKATRPHPGPSSKGAAGTGAMPAPSTSTTPPVGATPSRKAGGEAAAAYVPIRKEPGLNMPGSIPAAGATSEPVEADDVEAAPVVPGRTVEPVAARTTSRARRSQELYVPGAEAATASSPVQDVEPPGASRPTPRPVRVPYERVEEPAEGVVA